MTKIETQIKQAHATMDFFKERRFTGTEEDAKETEAHITALMEIIETLTRLQTIIE